MSEILNKRRLFYHLFFFYRAPTIMNYELQYMFGDKMKELTFKVIERPHGITFDKADITLICKKKDLNNE